MNRQAEPHYAHEKMLAKVPYASASDSGAVKTARVCALFDLATGALLRFAMGNKKSAELPLFRKQWDKFYEGDIFLGDKGFCSCFNIAMLYEYAVDSVVTLVRRTPVSLKHAIKKTVIPTLISCVAKHPKL